MQILFIQTGGTIDKDYPRTQKGYAFEIGPPAVVRILEKLNPSFSYEVQTVLQKDSLDITEQDRLVLRNVCAKSVAKHLIVTHGTDTLLETAAALAEIPNKVIILTGAMRPEQFANSDAPIQIGLAIGAVEYVPAGVYVAMHGRVIPWKSCVRNQETGQYERG